MTLEANNAAGDPKPAESVTIAVVAESAKVELREAVTGRVRITTRTETVTEDVRAALESADAKVTRVPINRYVEDGAPRPQPRTEGDTTIVPVFEEVLVVETRLLLKEEIHIELQKSVEQVAIPIVLHKQKADVERLSGPPPAHREPET